MLVIPKPTFLLKYQAITKIATISKSGWHRAIIIWILRGAQNLILIISYSVGQVQLYA